MPESMPEMVPQASQTDGRPRLPMPLITPAAANGLQRTSAAMGGRIGCVSKERLREPLGVLNAADLRAIRLGVAAVISLADVLVAARAVHTSTVEN